MNYKQKLLFSTISGIALGVVLTLYYLKPETIKVTKTQETERVFTRIVERPDGSKVTEITKATNKKKEASTVSTRKNDYIVGVSSSLNNAVPVQSLYLQRRIILDLYAGVYIRTDSEIGFIISYSF